MCRQNSNVRAGEEATIAEENLLIYCKPVELYNILRCRSLHNPLFLQRSLHYKNQAKRKRRLRTGVVIFNYRDYNDTVQKSEVTDDFSCPFCLMRCASFKGLRYHLCASHDLFNFEFWVTEEYQAVNVSVKIDVLRSETVTDGLDPQVHTFSFCSKPRMRVSKNPVQNEKHLNVQFLELDSPMLAMEGIHKGFLGKEDGIEFLLIIKQLCVSFSLQLHIILKIKIICLDVLSCRSEKVSQLHPIENHVQNGKRERENYGPDYPSSSECMERVASSFNIAGISIAMTQSSTDPECAKSQSGSDPMQTAKVRKLTAEKEDPRNRMLLQKRQFYHSHRVQPMALDQVLSDRDSEDEVDDDIADFEDRRMLDDFVDVTKSEKKLMHLWNSFVRKQRVLADGHVAWACEAFSKLHGQELVSSPPLFWCWRLFMIKLWNHGLLDAGAMNICNVILEGYRDQGSDSTNGGPRG